MAEILTPALHSMIYDLAIQIYNMESDANDSTIQTTPQLQLAQLSQLGELNLPFNYARLPKAVNDELKANHQQAFHHAVIIYFHRVIPEPYLEHLRKTSEARAVHVSTYLQDVIRKIWDHLENLDCLTRDTPMGRGNTLWPAFIAAAESFEVDLRHRAICWFARASKKGIGNIPRAKEVVMEVWRRVDRQLYDDDENGLSYGLGPVDWRDVMEDMGHTIMLT
ncbi:hypothetical protein BN1723_013297, partial [Verticillium longisporum]